MKSIRNRPFFLSRKAQVGSVSLGILGMVGCGAVDQSAAPVAQTRVAVHGKMFGGQQPIVGADTYVISVGIGGYGSGGIVLAHTVSDSSGSFDFGNSVTCPQNDTPEYIIGVGGNPGLGGGATNPNSVVGVALPGCAAAKSVSVNIDELSTVVLAYSMAQFFTTSYGVPSLPTLGSLTGLDAFGGPSSPGNSRTVYSLGLVNAMNKTVPSLLNSATGLLQPASPTFNIETAKINSIANTIAACINSRGQTSLTDNTSSCGILFTATTYSGNRPGDTLQAAVAMALHPYQNVATLYGLGGTTPPYQPALASAPHDLTVGVSYINPAVKLAVGNVATTSNLSIDAGGNIWLPTTTPAGIMSFTPGANAFGGPYTAAGVLGPQNVAIDREGLVWGADTASLRTQIFSVSSTAPGTPTLYPQNLGSTTVVAVDPFDIVGNIGVNILTPYLLDLNYPRVVGSQTANNIVPAHTVSSATGATDGNSFPTAEWAASYGGTTGYIESTENAGNEQVRATFPGGGSGQIAQYAPYNFIMTTPRTNTACVYLPPPSGTSSCLAANFMGMNAPQGVAVDGNNYIWVANSGNASVTELPGSNPNFTGGNVGFAPHGSGNGGTMVQPFGIGVDNSGNVWVSNQTATGGSYVLSELIGAGAPTITPTYAQYAGGRNAVGTPSQNTLVSIDAGSTVPVGSFLADTYLFTATGAQGPEVMGTRPTDTTDVAYAAPAEVYRTGRAGDFSYKISGLAPNSTHTVLLHFSETFWTAVNQRVFNININGVRVETNLDIFARAPGNYRALVLTYTATADPNGAITVLFLRGPQDQPKLSGIQIQ